MLAQLRTWGVIEMMNGRRRVALIPPPSATESQDSLTKQAVVEQLAESRLWSVVLRGPDGRRYPPRLVSAVLNDATSFLPHLDGIARMENVQGVEGLLSNCELEIYEPGASEPILTLR